MIRSSFWVFQLLLHSALSATLPTVNIISTSDDDESYSVTSPNSVRQTSERMIFTMSSFSQSPSDGTLSPASPACGDFDHEGCSTDEPSDTISVNTNTPSVLDFLAESLNNLTIDAEADSDGEYEFWYKSLSYPYIISPNDREVFDTPGRNERAMFFNKVTEHGINGSPLNSLHQKQVRLESRPSPAAPQSLEEDDGDFIAGHHQRGHRSMSDISDVIHHHILHPSDPLPVGAHKHSSNASSVLFLKDHHLK